MMTYCYDYLQICFFFFLVFYFEMHDQIFTFEFFICCMIFFLILIMLKQLFKYSVKLTTYTISEL